MSGITGFRGRRRALSLVRLAALVISVVAPSLAASSREPPSPAASETEQTSTDAADSARAAMATMPTIPSQKAAELATSLADLTGRALEIAWPSRPQWGDMLVAILRGEAFEDGKGWWRGPVAAYDWDWLRERCDADGDGRIDIFEVPSIRTYFDRLDTDEDGAWTRSDFEGPPPPRPPRSISTLFRQLDGDGDELVSWDEMALLFARADRRKRGFITERELAAVLPSLAAVEPLAPATKEAARATPSPAESSTEREDGVPGRWGLARLLWTGQLGCFTEGPALGHFAPDFALAALGSGESVRLQEVSREKPVVLVFGSVSCAPFRRQFAGIESLYRRYRTRAAFFFVYIREAHPTDGWRMRTNDRDRVSILQPRSTTERCAAAESFRAGQPVTIPILLDTIDNAVDRAYSALPNRLYLIDRRGRVVHKGGRGPVGWDVESLERSLILTLLEDSTGDL